MCCGSRRRLLNSHRGNVRTYDDSCSKRRGSSMGWITRWCRPTEEMLRLVFRSRTMTEQHTLLVSVSAARLHYTINRKNRRDSNPRQPAWKADGRKIADRLSWNASGRAFIHFHCDPRTSEADSHPHFPT